MTLGFFEIDEDWETRAKTPEQVKYELSEAYWRYAASLCDEEAWLDSTGVDRYGNHDRHDWVLEVEEGVARVYCTKCHSEPYPDSGDLLYVNPIPVTVQLSVHIIRHHEYPDEQEIEMEVVPYANH